MPSQTKASTPTSATQFLSTPKDEPSIKPKEEKVRVLAFLKWEEAGSPLGDDDRFWFEAENELIEAEDYE